MFDPELKDMYHCHPYQFLEICIPQVNEPIESYQIQHRKIIYVIPTADGLQSVLQCI